MHLFSLRLIYGRVESLLLFYPIAAVDTSFDVNSESTPFPLFSEISLNYYKGLAFGVQYEIFKELFFACYLPFTCFCYYY